MKLKEIRGSRTLTLPIVLLLGVISAPKITAKTAITHAQEKAAAPRTGSDKADKDELRVLHVQGSVYALTNAGTNITLQVGNDGVLVVNAGRAAMSQKVLAAIRALSDKPIRFLIDTDDDADTIGGNEVIAAAGRTIAGGNILASIGESAGATATVVAFQTVLDRMSTPTGKNVAAPEGAWPTDSYTVDHKDLYFNDEDIRIFHEPAAHTDGDSVVFFRRSDVVSMGDFYLTTNYPVIDTQRGGSIQGTVKALNFLMRLAITRNVQGGFGDQGGTMLIPGHGRICDRGDLAYYQEMVTIIRDRVQDSVKNGMTLDQVRASKPTLDYDPRYGKNSGPWTTDMFLEAVYSGLSKTH